jgi:hypothetical protein
MNRKQQSSNDINHIFERGDIISSSSKKDVRLILNAKNREYYFMHLKSQSVKDIFGNIFNIEKGHEASQPADIVEKHFYLVEL